MTEIVQRPASELAPQRELTVLDIIREVAADPASDLNKLEKLLAMQERAQANEARVAYQKAMRDVQEEIPPIRRDAKNESSHSRYARLETIIDAIRPIYTKHGFSLSYGSAEPRKEGALRVVCKVHHSAGHAENFELEGELDTVGPKGLPNKTPIQGLGSSVSYLRRYLVTMIFNVVLCNEDNDGQRLAGPITQEQADTIRDYMPQIVGPGESEAAEQSKFLKYIGAKIISEIRSQDYTKAITALEAKARKVRGA